MCVCARAQVEGAETAVLSATFDWDAFTFLTLSVERPPPDLNARRFRHGYLFVRNRGYDTLFVHDTHPRARLLAANASFEQLPAKCRVAHGKYTDGRHILRGLQCRSRFGCCSFPGWRLATKNA